MHEQRSSYDKNVALLLPVREREGWKGERGKDGGGREREGWKGEREREEREGWRGEREGEMERKFKRG
jgi:hypothetical protein